MKTIAERLKWARKTRGMTQAALAAKAGITTSAIGNVESGLRERPRELLDIARALGASPLWLESGKGAWEDQPERNVEIITTHNVPVISWVQAGNWTEIADNFQPGDAEQWLPCPVRHGPRTFVLVVRGLSMYNPGGDLSFKDGDKIFVDPDQDAIHRSLVIARLDDENEATFKQLLIESQTRMLLALNPSWPNRIMQIDGNCTLSGVVVGKLESFV